MQSIHIHNTARFILLLLALSSLSGCLMLRTCPNQLSTNNKLRGEWNTLKRIQDPQTKQAWAIRFLDTMLEEGTYQLEKDGSSFAIIDPKETHENRCKINTQRQIRQLRDPSFLKVLYKWHSSKRINIQKYIYKPPKVFVVQGAKHSAWGGDCRGLKYRTDVRYWKIISGRHQKETWKEACTLGQKLKKWHQCFNATFRTLFQARMKVICQ